MTEPAALLTAAKPPLLDKLTASIAGAISALLLSARVGGVMPDIAIPPDLVLVFVTAIATIAATIRGMRETKAQGGTAALISDLVAQVSAMREQIAGASAVTTPIGEPLPTMAPMVVPIPAGVLVKRQGG